MEEKLDPTWAFIMFRLCHVIASSLSIVVLECWKFVIFSTCIVVLECLEIPETLESSLQPNWMQWTSAYYLFVNLTHCR